MFGKRKNEKFKMVFMLQFHATQVTSSVTKLMVSLIPADVGQPTVKLGKSPVQEGICKWDNPIYETVKFTRDAKTKALQDKIYFFSVATGSSKKGFIGEIGINLVDYIDANIPVTVDLPIQGLKASVVLHVIVQNMQGDQSVEENAESSVQSARQSVQHQISISRSDSKEEYNSIEDGYNDVSVPQDEERRRNHAVCTTSNTSLPKQLKLDWSSDDDELFSLTKSSADNSFKKHQQRNPESQIEQLRGEISSLKRQADVSELEIQTLRRQIGKENKSRQELSDKIASLEEERDSLKIELERKSYRKIDNGNHAAEEKEDGGKSRSQLKEIEQDLTHEKSLTKKLRWQLQQTQDSNSELILTVRDLEQTLKRKDKEMSHISSKLRSSRKDELSYIDDSDHIFGRDKQREIFRGPTAANNKCEEVDELRQTIADLEGELEDHFRTRMELENRIDKLVEDYETSKQEKQDISLKFDRMQLEMTSKEKLCEDYQKTTEDLESQLSRLEKVIQKQAEEFFESAEIIRELETELKTLDEELTRRTEQFESDLLAKENARTELEERAVQAEEALRKTRDTSSTAAQQLQEEYEKMSLDLASKFDEKEKVIQKAQREASELRAEVEVLEERVQKANEELRLMKNLHDSEVQALSEELCEKEKQLQQLSIKLEREVLELRSAKQKEEDKCEVFSKENQTLRTEIERLAEENYHFSKQSEQAQHMAREMELMKSSIGEKGKLLEVTNKERDHLEQRHELLNTKAQQLQDTLDNMKVLKETRDEMVEALQSKMGKLSVEHNKLKHDFLNQKTECENLRKQLVQHKKDVERKSEVIAQMEEQINNFKEVAGRKEKPKQIKGVRCTGASPGNGNKAEERRLSGTKLQELDLQASGISTQNGASRPPGKSRREASLLKNQKSSTDTNNESNLTQLLAEVALMKEKNKSMEDELKEMQEKYSEVSLRFAEVEGERQQLVMAVRNLRNGQKR